MNLQIEARKSRDKKKEECRARVLEVAREVFFRDGFLNANLDEVAENAGVAKGTLYRHFQNKADLYIAVLMARADLFTKKLEDAIAKSVPGLDRVRAISQFYCEYWIRHPDYFQIFWAVENQAFIGALPQDVSRAIAALWERNLGIFSRAIRESIEQGDLIECDCKEVAFIIWCTLAALIRSQGSSATRDLTRQSLHVLLDDTITIILRGLAARSDAALAG